MREFEGKTVLVTGAGIGIGHAHALHFAQQGATVIVHDIEAAFVDETMQCLRKIGSPAHGIVCDVRDTARFGMLIRETAEKAGGVDILINNVGVPAKGPVEDITPETFDAAFRINVYSFIEATKAVLPEMKQKKYGKIVNTSSNWGLVGHEDASLYSATKAAILGLTKAWALEFAPWNINVNCIAPGGINTRLLKTSEDRISRIPMKRHGEPEEVAQLAAFLASDKSSYMTGNVLTLTGGELIVGI